MTKVKMIVTKIEKEIEATISLEDLRRLEENLYKLCIDEDTGGMFGIVKNPIPSIGLDKYDIIEIFGLLPELKQKWMKIYNNLSKCYEGEEREEYEKLYKWVKGLPTLS